MVSQREAAVENFRARRRNVQGSQDGMCHRLRADFNAHGLQFAHLERTHHQFALPSPKPKRLSH